MPAITRYLEAEVRCFLCGQEAGSLRREHEAPNLPSTFRRLDGGPILTIKSLTGLRCAHCSGSLYADEFQLRVVYPEERLKLERPRRGRPPKWLVEARRALESMEDAERAS
jgi:hypothetical protein